MGSHGSGFGGGRGSQELKSGALSRQGSLYNLTLDEVQNHLGDLGKHPPTPNFVLMICNSYVFRANLSGHVKKKQRERKKKPRVHVRGRHRLTFSTPIPTLSSFSSSSTIPSLHLQFKFSGEILRQSSLRHIDPPVDEYSVAVVSNYSSPQLSLINRLLVMSAMEDTQSVATLIDSTTCKIQQLQKAFAELESHRAVTLNLKWKQLEEHFHGLEKSLKRRFYELEDQEKEYEIKTAKAQEVLKKREAVVIAKEQASLEKLQQKRDAAISAIVNTKEKSACADPIVVKAEDDQIGPHIEEEKEKPPDFTPNGNVEVKSHPQLVKLCHEMDSNGLHKFISDNRKNLATIKDEIPIALRASANPANLVLDSLKGFYEGSSTDGKKDSNLVGLRRTCIMLMECLSILIMELDGGTVSNLISQEIKERAKGVAEEWKPTLGDLDLDASNGNSLEAHAFLQLVATFGINSDFDQEDLSKLIPMVSRRRQTADLCRSLGLSEKMPDVIDVLISNGRQINAVNLAFAFELTKQFCPVSLLKSYLTDAKKVFSPVKSGNSTPVLNEINERELTALKAVIKCIEDHQLEHKYPVDPLQKRVLHLEKAKADNKRATEVSKPQPKRPRANGNVGYGSTRAATATNGGAADKNMYARTTDKYPQYMYDRPYGYVGSTGNHMPFGTPAYSITATGHGNYFANVYQHQTPYLH